MSLQNIKILFSFDRLKIRISRNLRIDYYIKLVVTIILNIYAFFLSHYLHQLQKNFNSQKEKLKIVYKYLINCTYFRTIQKRLPLSFKDINGFISDTNIFNPIDYFKSWF